LRCIKCPEATKYNKSLTTLDFTGRDYF
jgi:hypothetical protein